MLEIMFHAETPKDRISPITVSTSLIESKYFNGAELEEIAEHLLAYTKRFQLEKKLAGVDI